VTEIKEIKEKQQKEDDIVQSIAAGAKHPLIPHLEFDFSDADIHEDLYKLVRYSCEEVFSCKELFNKIMRLWSTFLEPMLGVTSQSHGTERIEDRKVGQSARSSVAPNVGGDGSPHRDSISRLPKSDKTEVEGRVTEVKNGHQTSVATNGKENGSVGRDDLLMDNKGQKSVECSDKAPGFGKQISSDEQAARNPASVTIRGESSVNRTNLDTSPGLCIKHSYEIDVL
jgi:paired amphipathic helix protein Sin3a